MTFYNTFNSTTQIMSMVLVCMTYFRGGFSKNYDLKTDRARNRNHKFCLCQRYFI